MQSKSLLIAVAAFAVTTTGAYAFNDDVLQKAGLSETQVEAIHEAKEKREDGDLTTARDILIEAGVGEEELRSIHKAAHEVKKERRSDIESAIDSDDFEAFQVAVEGTRLEESVTSEDEFEVFKEAHELRENGDFEEAAELLAELGIEPKGKKHLHRAGYGKMLDQLSSDQREAFMVAKQAGDRETMRSILDEAGVERFGKGFHGR